MSITIERNSESPWRKRSRSAEKPDNLDIDIKDSKKQRRCYYRLASESSKTSEDDTESIYSLQGKETDVVKDTSDTDSHEDSDRSQYEVEFEYEVASLSEGGDHAIIISSSDSEDMMLAAAAAVICDSDLETWVTDGEDSDTSSDETSFGRSDFSTCVQCRGENINPLYRYCEKCFQSCKQCKMHKTYKCFPLCQTCYQDRKKFFPPRPRPSKRKSVKGPIENHVKLDTLQNCLNGLSQDSGIGSSQECPPLGLDQIVVPEHLRNAGPSKTEDISSTTSEILTTIDEVLSDTSQLNDVSSSGKDSRLKRKRTCSESSLSDCEAKKAKIVSNNSKTSDLGSDGCSIGKSSFSSETSGSFSLSYAERASSSISEKSDTELCMFCNSAPKDSIFLHTNIAHRCCCYKCAKKTLKTIKRCPICNRSVNKVVKIFTS